MNAARTILLLTCIVLFLYPALMRVLARAVQKKRLRLVEIGAVLSRRDDLPTNYRSMVIWCIETAYSPWVMVNLVVTMPLFLVDLLRGKARHQEIPSEELERLVNEMISLHIASVAAANPLFALVASMEWAVALFILFPFGKGGEAVHIQTDALARAKQIRHHLRAA